MSGKLVGHYLIVGWLRVACRNWVWLAVYIMYCGQLPFFTLADCGPEGLAGWQVLQGEAAVFGILLLGELFLGGESVAGNDKGVMGREELDAQSCDGHSPESCILGGLGVHKCG